MVVCKAAAGGIESAVLGIHKLDTQQGAHAVGAESAVKVKAVYVVPGKIEHARPAGTAVLFVAGFAVKSGLGIIQQFQCIDGVHAEHRGKLQTFDYIQGQCGIAVKLHTSLLVVAQIAVCHTGINKFPERRAVRVSGVTIVIIQPRGHSIQIVRREDGDGAVI